MIFKQGGTLAGLPDSGTWPGGVQNDQNVKKCIRFWSKTMFLKQDSQTLRFSNSQTLRFSDSQILRLRLSDSQFSGSQILRLSVSQTAGLDQYAYVNNRIEVSESQILRISKSQLVTLFQAGRFRQHLSSSKRPDFLVLRLPDSYISGLLDSETEAPRLDQ